jgi:hypothetical protein
MDNLPNKKNEGSLVNQEKFSNELSIQKDESKKLLNKKLDLWGRLLPSVEQKAAKKHMQAILEQESKAEIEKHRMANEFFTQALQATFDDVLTKGVVTIQEGQTKDFAKRKAALAIEISELSHNFFIQMDTDYAKLNEIKNDNLRDKQESMLDSRTDEFVRTVSHLMEKFEDATKKSVGKKG